MKNGTAAQKKLFVIDGNSWLWLVVIITGPCTLFSLLKPAIIMNLFLLDLYGFFLCKSKVADDSLNKNFLLNLCNYFLFILISLVTFAKNSVVSYFTL